MKAENGAVSADKTAAETLHARPASPSQRLRATLASTTTLEGYGIHSGAPCRLTLSPAPTGTGYVFRRVDLPDAPAIPVSYDYLAVEELDRRTTLRLPGGTAVHTIEHVISALAGCDIDDAYIDVTAAEPPFLDGSALPYARAIIAAGSAPSAGDQPLQRLILTTPITYLSDGAEISAIPSAELRVTFFFTSNHPALRSQSQSFAITPEVYLAEIAPARTFCFFEEIEMLRQANLIKGANLSSAVVIGRKSIINDSLRFPDEPVRHKILDFLGDISLLKTPVQAHYLVWRGGHRHNALFGKYLQKELNL